MKRKIYVAGLFMPIAAYVIGFAYAQQPVATAPAPAVTKVGVVNIGNIYSKWDKLKVFRSKFYPELKPFRDEEEKLKKSILDWQTYLSDWENELTEQQKDDGKRSIDEYKRRLEKLSIEYRKKVAEIQEKEFVQHYKEINDEVKREADSQGYHLILGYGEPLDGDLLTFVNVTRKMQAMDQGAAVTMYFADWMDISPQVLANLNQPPKRDAQQPVATPPTPTAAKVGVVNIGYVFGGYRKVRGSRFKNVGQEPQSFRDEEEKLNKLIIDWQNALSNPDNKLTAAQKEQGRRTITDCKRRLEDLGAEYRKMFSKNSEEQLVRLYKEVNDEVKRIAEVQGYHLILGYGEPMDGDLFSYTNVTRKIPAMDQGAAIPMYFADRTDISRQVLENLNRPHGSESGPMPAGGK